MRNAPCLPTCSSSCVLHVQPSFFSYCLLRPPSHRFADCIEFHLPPVCLHATCSAECLCGNPAMFLVRLFVCCSTFVGSPLSWLCYLVLVGRAALLLHLHL
ncbi:hypothetical protein ACQJBY_032713 [Aegilops geniculata]